MWVRKNSNTVFSQRKYRWSLLWFHWTQRHESGDLFYVISYGKVPNCPVYLSSEAQMFDGWKWLQGWMDGFSAACWTFSSCTDQEKKSPSLNAKEEMTKTSSPSLLWFSLPLFLFFFDIWLTKREGGGVPFYGRGWFRIRNAKIHYKVAGNDLSHHSSLKVHQSKYSSFWKVL